MDVAAICIATVTGPVGGALVARVLGHWRKKHSPPHRRAATPLFINGEKEQIVTELNDLVTRNRYNAKRITEIFEVLGDIDRRLYELESPSKQ
jgi:hypothetical protein